jgi:hypothetical protein
MTDRILTTPAGSLPRPEELAALLAQGAELATRELFARRAA